MVCSIKVVIDGTWQTYAWDVVFRCNHLCTSEGAVTSDHNKCIDAVCLEILMSLCTTFLIKEVLASRCTEDGTATVDRAADTLRCKILYFIIDKAFPASVDSLYVPSVLDSRTSDGSDGCIHSRSISAGSKNAYCIDSCHIVNYVWSNLRKSTKNLLILHADLEKRLPRLL